MAEEKEIKEVYEKLNDKNKNVMNMIAQRNDDCTNRQRRGNAHT